MEQPKTLIIMRHAQAEVMSESQLDEQRELTKSGIKQARKVMKYLISQKLVPQKIVTSPLVRSQQTATHMIKYAKKSELTPVVLELNEAIALSAPVKLFTEMVNQEFDAWPDVTLLISHEPNISRYFGALLGSKTSVFNVKKGSIGIFELYAPTQAKLSAFISPKLLG